jgi:long-chain acyl-CoA synthetase
MQGYWKQPAETANAFKDGWLLTGDIARMDEEGYFYIVDRRKDMVLVSGFNVFPNEVEDVIVTLKGVKECAVIGIPDPLSGEAVKAFLVTTDVGVTADHVQAHCRKQLAAYKVPKTIEFRSELPKSAVGKILRKDLRAGTKEQVPDSQPE